MSGEALTVVYWTRPNKRRNAGGRWVDAETRSPTKVHVSRDGTSCACGTAIPPEAIVVAVTQDWYIHTNCYNCAYRLWPEHAPPGYARPRNSTDFPPRRECPHEPGRGLDPQFCSTCTPPPGLEVRSRPPQSTEPEVAPTPARIRVRCIPSPYALAGCAACGDPVEVGELINIEYEAGVVHVLCPT